MPCSEKEFVEGTNEVDKLWDRISQTSFHLRQRKPALSDIYYKALIYNILNRWISARQGMKVLKLDMYNEATWTRYSYYFMEKRVPVTYIDVSRIILRKAVENIKTCNLLEYANPVLGDFRKLPFKTNCFDVTCSFGSIEHVPQWRDCLVEQIRVTKRGGALIVGVPNLQNIWLRYHFCRLFDKLGVLKKYTSYELHFQPNYLKRELEKLHLDDIELTGYHLFPKQLRWLDLWMEKYPRSAFSACKRFWLKPILELFYRLELQNTKINLLSEMLIAKGVKKIRI